MIRILQKGEDKSWYIWEPRAPKGPTVLLMRYIPSKPFLAPVVKVGLTKDESTDS